jgi:hypothetical protein
MICPRAHSFLKTHHLRNVHHLSLVFDGTPPHIACGLVVLLTAGVVLFAATAKVYLVPHNRSSLRRL